MTSKTYFYPQKMGRAILLGLEEVMGKQAVEEAFRPNGLENISQNPRQIINDQIFSFETVSAIQSSLEQTYGPLGGRGVALQTGRASFKYVRNEYGSMLGLADPAFRILPMKQKLKIGIQKIADLFNNHTDQVVWVEEKEKSLFWHIDRCPVCWGRKESEPVCHLAVGLLQEAMTWLSGGKVFQVEESACAAFGDKSCTIFINTVPYA